MAHQITAEGVGSLLMVAIGILGVILWIDTWQFVNNGDGILSSFSIAIHIDMRLRALALFILGGLLIMFASGVWTVQVGASAIILCLFLAGGNYWTSSSARGVAETQTVTILEKTDKKEIHCPLTAQQKAWCAEDTDGDGITNQYDEDFNTGNRSGRKNCERNYYITANKECN